MDKCELTKKQIAYCFFPDKNEEILKIKWHFSECPECKRYFVQMEEIVDRIKKYGTDTRRLP